MPPRTLFASTLGIIQLAIQPKFGCPDGEAHFYNDETVNGTNLFFERTVQPKEDERAAFRLRSNLTKYSASLQASYDQVFKKNCQKFANYIVEEKLAISNAAMTVQNPPNQHPSSDSDPSQNGGAHDNNDSEADQEEPVSMKEDAVEPQSYLQTCNNGTNVANHQQIEGVLADVNEVAVELRNYPVKDSNFLSTDHIDYFIELLRTIGNPSYSFCQVNSTVSSTLVMQNEPDFDEFARHCTPFDDETRFCFLPLCRNEHWTLVVLDRVFWSVTHYDPLIRHNTGNTSTVRFGQEVFQRIFGISCRPQISPVILPDSWVQKDSFNCGVYVSRFMERIAMHGQDWQNEPHQLDIKTERRRMQLIFDEIAHTKRYPSQWRTGSITMASNNAQTEVPVQSKIPNPIQASSIPSPLSKRQSSFFNMPDINGAAKVNVDPVSSDINRDCEMIDMTVTPSKQCRLSKRKGTRKLSQATKLKMKRNASQLHYKRLKVASQSNQIAVDNALMDLATLSVQDNVLQGSSVSDTITSKQASLRLKRKKPTQGALATPSPVIRKRPSTYNENVIAPDDLHENSNNTEADDIDLARENIFIFADDDEPSNLTANDLPFQATQTSACLQVNPSESDCCDKSLNENTFEHYNHFEDDVIDSDNEHQNDYQNDGMRLDMEIALKKPQSSEEFEHDEILDDDHEPTYVEADANYDVDELPVNPFDIGTAFSMNDIITPHPTYRNDSEMVGFLTAMAYFAVKEGGHWRSIGILDSSICELQTLAAPIKNYMRGYYENPELILHPAFSRGCSGTDVGHWFLIAIDVTRYNMTVYDSLLDPSYQNDKDKVLPDPRYIEYANKVCDRLIQGKLIVRRPSYIRHRPHSYNKQEDGANCGVHVARIAEELAFNGTTHELYPFNIKAELHRMWKTCREIHFEEGLPKAWPQTCQAAAFPLVDEDTHAIQRLPKPIKLQKKAKKKVLKPLKEEHLPASTVPLKSEPRRSARLSTKQLTKEIDNIIFDQQQRQDTKKSGIPLARLSANFIPEPCSFGKMDKICQYCGARLFWAETSNRCCGCGTIPVTPFKRYPQAMEAVFKDPEFIKNFRAFNTMMSFVSVACQLQRQMDIFVVCGEFKYHVGDILPQGDALPRFEQNYCFDPDEAVNNRNNDAARFGLDPLKYADPDLVSTLEGVVRKHHPLARKFKLAAEVYRKEQKAAEKEGKELQRAYLVWEAREPTDGTHAGQYSKPSVQNTVFKLWRSDGSRVPEKCLMLSIDRSNGFRREIPFYSAHIDPAAYPLMFIYGELGWQPEIPKCDPASRLKPKAATNRSSPSSKKPGKRKIDPSKRRLSSKSSPAYFPKKRHNQLHVPRRRTRLSQLPCTTSQPVAPVSTSKTGIVSSMTQPAPVIFPNNTQTSSMKKDSTVTDDEAEDGPGHNPYVSMRGFHVSRLYDRNDREQFVFHPITGARKLTHVYIIDTFLKAEHQKLDKLEEVQLQLEKRGDRCKSLREYLERLKDKDPALKDKKVGRLVLLTHDYRSSPADMRRRYRNGVAINARVGRGKSDLFVTFTGNPNWPEIQENLRTTYDPPEKWTDRPELVNRVFILYAKAFLRDVLVHGVLGKVIAYNYSVEHQKRGMPHIHLLLILHKKDRKLLRTAKGINDLLCAELPEFPDEDGTVRTSRLRYYRKLVETKYMHHPSRCKQFCGMNKRDPSICNKRYPKPFSEVTIPNATGYAELRRPKNGRFVPSKWKGKPFKLTNRYVVPHNRFLALKYDCHINIEDVRNVRSIKYIYKYNFKGHDRGFVKAVQALGKGADPDVIDYNEIELYRNTRVIGAAEADMRLRTGLPVTKCSHTVQVLPVHLPAEHTVTFTDGATSSQLEQLVAEDGVAEDSSAVSQLTAFFQTVREEDDDDDYKRDPARAWNLHYAQMPEHYIWERKKKEWRRRIVNRKCIGRMDTVYPSNRERYCLRELLHHRKGPKSFKDLRTVNGRVMETFEAAAFALELFVDDRLSVRTMKEAIAVATPRNCRLTFALLMVFNRPQDPDKLWNMFKNDLISNEPFTASLHERERRALAHIASILYHHGLSMTSLALPEVTNEEIMEAITNDFTDDEYERDVDGSTAYSQLNVDQRSFVDRVTDAVHDSSKHKLFFLQGSGGTGKTFVYNTLIRRLRHQGKTVLAVASTGVAAILLHGGQTVHSAFKLPIDFDELRSVSAQNTKAVLATRADIIIWDEAPMQHNIIVRTVDGMLRDWMGNKFAPFGGKVVVMGGDFKQILPVVPGGTVHDAYAASLLCCPVFIENFAVFTLTSNIRAEKDPAYAAWIQSVGFGEDRVLDSRPGKENNLVIRFPADIVEKSKQKVMDFVYPRSTFDPSLTIEQYQKVVEKAAIVAPTNALVDLYNSLIVSVLPKKARCYKAVNWPYKTENTEEDTLRSVMDTEIMQVFEKPGFALQNLILKERSVVMLTRNLCIRSGLCNGTRMIVLAMFDTILQCRLITGSKAGSIVAIPMVEHVHDDAKDDAFPPFIRLQFPIRPAFAISINKSQGQTLSRVGIMLDSQCFAHGQLYVALSRAGSSKNVKVYLPISDFIRDGATWTGLGRNIVHRQVIQAVEHNMQQLFKDVM